MAPIVKMRALISGSRDGKKWPKPGETIELPAAEAAQLIGQGIAVAFTEPETATASQGNVETTTATGNPSLRRTADEAAKAAAAQAAADEAAKAAAAKAAAEEAAKAAADKAAKEAPKADKAGK